MGFTCPMTRPGWPALDLSTDMMKKHVFAVALSVCALGSVASAACLGPQQFSNDLVKIPDGLKDYPFNGQGVFALEVLRAFSEEVEISIFIDPEIDDMQIDLMRESFTRESFLQKVTRSAGLVWYFDGSILQVLPLDAVETKVIPLKDSLALDALTALEEIGILQSRFLHCFGESNQVLRVTGPSKYVESVEEAVTALETAELTVAKRITVPIQNAPSAPVRQPEPAREPLPDQSLDDPQD